MDVDEITEADFDVVLGEEYSVNSASEVVFCSSDDEVEEVMILVVVNVDT